MVIINDRQGPHWDVMNHSFPHNPQLLSLTNDSQNSNVVKYFVNNFYHLIRLKMQLVKQKNGSSLNKLLWMITKTTS